MHSYLFIILFAFMSFGVNAQNLPKVVSGSLKHIEKFPSKFIEARNIDIWLPEGYNTKQKYAVLYMHDGQMLYDTATTWNHQSWDVDDIATALMKEGKTKKFIVVGVWNNGGSRHANYFPQKPYDSLTTEQKNYVVKELQKAGRTTEVFNPNSDDYLKFLVTELKPFIDSVYSTNSNRNNTFIAGSSMGGLISMYAICEYPSVFGGAACLSTHWVGTFSVENNPIPDAFIQYLKNNLPKPKKHKIYFDYGDQTLDALYPPLQAKVDAVMKAKGFTDKNWKTIFFKGQDHSEKSWNGRFDIPLMFLLKK